VSIDIRRTVTGELVPQDDYSDRWERLCRQMLGTSGIVGDGDPAQQAARQAMAESYAHYMGRLTRDDPLLVGLYYCTSRLGDGDKLILGEQMHKVVQHCGVDGVEPERRAFVEELLAAGVMDVATHRANKASSARLTREAEEQAQQAAAKRISESAPVSRAEYNEAVNRTALESERADGLKQKLKETAEELATVKRENEELREGKPEVKPKTGKAAR
jgi:succinate dehydrogenase/fumarate reductase flavoprotein subunit